MQKDAERFLPDRELVEKLKSGRLANPHYILGMHEFEEGRVVRVYDPEATKITILAGRVRVPMTLADGIFVAYFPDAKDQFPYKLERVYGDKRKYVAEDPYFFLPGVGEMDVYLFNKGEHRRIYDVLGSHVRNFGGVEGVEFAVWAPNAQRVSVVGDFNGWDGRRNPMRLLGSSGIWELFIPGLKSGEVYKYEVRNCNGDCVLKLDPYVQQTELRPNNAGIVPEKDPFEWHDEEWMTRRAHVNPLETPLNIYEAHLGTWGGEGLKLPPVQDPPLYNNYRECAVALAAYLKKMGYTHIELLPIMEHPLDISWGYQVSGFYAPTARYGSPRDFAFFVDYMHQNGIGVILDWVPAHFPKDLFCLGRFDGTALYEHADPRQGEQKDWGTYIFNFGRNEVRNFLMANALFWMEKYHVDGLRVDAVASMIYLNYSREDGEWIPNKYGGCENLEAIDFIRNLNELTHRMFPGIMMIAEESTSWPGVSRPLYLGGLGFTFKWNMGWMHDTLDYFKLDPIYRSYHHGQLAFSICYAFSENFILPLSHDEVVHGKLSLFGRMSGDYAQKFANLRALFGYMATHPGKKMLFMGGEIAQVIEWNEHNQSLDWLLLKYPIHDAFHRMVRELNAFYLSQPALWEVDFRPEGFQWIDGGNVMQSVYAYMRWDKDGSDPLLVILNLTPVVRDDFNIGVPLPGEWVELFNTDREEYGGTGLLNLQKMESKPGEMHGQKQFITLRLPWLSCIVLGRRKQ